MANKLNWRLTLIAVAVFVVLAIAVGAIVTLNPAAAKADGAPISNIIDEWEYGFLSTSSILYSIENGTKSWLDAEYPSSAIDGGYSGTITATVYELDQETVVDTSATYLHVGQYKLFVEWTANGAFEEGNDWFDFAITKKDIDIDLESMFKDDWHYGDTLTYDGETLLLSSSYFQGGGFYPVGEDDASVTLGFYNDLGEAYIPVNAGVYTITAKLEGKHKDNYTLVHTWFDGENWHADRSEAFIDMEITMQPKYIPVSFNLRYHDRTSGDVFKTVEDIPSYQTGIAYIAADFDLVATTTYTEEIDGDDVAVVKPVISGWNGMTQGSVLAPNLPDTYSVSGYSIEALVDGVLASNYVVDPMSMFGFTVEKREMRFNQWATEAPYRGGDATHPVYNWDAERTTFEEDNSVYISYLPVYWVDVVMECSYSGVSWEVGDVLDVMFSFNYDDDQLFSLSASSDSTSVNFVVVKADPIVGGSDEHEQIETWYCFETMGLLDYTQFVQSKIDFNIKSYNDLVNIQLDSTTWAYWDDENETWESGSLPIDVDAGVHTLRVYTKATTEYNAKDVYVNVTISKAPVYAVWKEESTVFEYSGISTSIQRDNFEYYLFEVKEGNEALTLVPDVFDPYGLDDGYFFYPVGTMDGEYSELWAGDYTATLVISNNNRIAERFEIVNPEFKWSIAHRSLTFAETTLNIPATFTYGGEDGATYYAKPVIDYIKSSKSCIYGEWFDAEDPSVVSGEITGFDAVANSYKYPYEEKWEYNTVSASYDGEWTLWTESVYPKDAGMYYVRYSATFCKCNTKFVEEPADSGNWIEVIDPDSFVPEKGTFKVNYVYGAFNIVARDLTFSWGNLDGHTYNNEAFDATLEVGNLAYDDKAEVVTYTTGIKAAGSHTITAATNGNYNLPDNYTATLVIAKRALTVTADDKNVSYGDAIPAYTVSYSNWAAGENAAVLGGELDFACAYEQYSNVIVSGYTVTPSGYESANYTFTYVPGTVYVAPVGLTVTADDKAVTYGDAAPTYTVTYSGFLGDDDKTDLIGNLVFDCEFAQYVTGEGNYAITPGGYTSANYDITFVPGTLTVSKKALSVTAEAKTVKYGEAPVFTVTYNGFAGEDTAAVLGGNLAFDTTFDASNKETRKVGTYAITPKGYASNKYEITYYNNTLTVIPTALTVTADNKAIKTNADLPAYTVTYSGLVYGETAPATVGTVTCPTANNAVADDYEIVVAGFADENYDISMVNGVLTIGKTPLSVSIVLKEITYGDAVPAASAYTLDYDTEGGVDDLDKSNLEIVFVGTPYVVRANAGDYTIKVSGIVSEAYTIVAEPSTLRVGKKALTVGVQPIANITYGDATPTFVATYTGLVEGDNAGNIGGNLSWNCIYDQGYVAYRAVGEYSVTPYGYSSTNYQVSYEGATFQVEKKALTVTSDAKAITYGDKAPEWTLSYTGFVYDDDSTVFVGGISAGCAYDTANAQQRNSGSYKIAINYQNNPGNYAVSKVENYLTVAKKDITITAAAQTITYGDEAPAYTVTYEGLAYDETVTAVKPTITCAYVAEAGNANRVVGTYDIVLSDAADDNYTIKLVNATLTVDKKAITVKPDDKAITYGDAAPECTYDSADFAFGETIADLAGDVDYKCAYANLAGNANRVVGTYNIDLYKTLSSDNYSISYATGTLTVAQKAITITANPQTITYGDEAPAYTVTYEGLVYGETATAVEPTIACSYVAKAGSSLRLVGNYEIVLSNASDDNYAITLKSGILHVEKKAVTIVIDSDANYYGEALPTYYKSTCEDLAYTDTIDNVCVIAKDKGIDAATYAIRGAATDFGAANYDISFSDGTWTIMPKTLEVTVLSQHVTYGDAAPEFADNEQFVTIEGFVYDETKDVVGGKLVFNTDYDVTNPDERGVSEYNLTAGGYEAANYVFNYTYGSLIVDAKAVTVTAADKTSVYGDALVELTADYALAYSDVAADVFSLVKAEGLTAGEYAINVVSADNANYVVTGVAATYSITKRPVTVTVADKTSVYDTNPVAITSEVTEGTIANEDEVYTIACSVVKASEVGEYDITGATTEYGAANYTVTFVNGKYSVTKAQAVIDDSAMKMELPYTGNALVFDGATAAYEENRAALTYSANSFVNVGEYTVTVTIADTKNFVGTSKTYTVKVLEAEPTKGADGKEEFYKDIDDTAAASTGVDIKAIIANAAKAGDNAGLTLNIGEGDEQSTIVLDAAAIKALDGKDVKLTFKTIEGDDAAAAQKGAALVLEISLGAQFEGSATVTVPFVNNAPGGKVAKVFYVDENGKKVNMNGTFENDTVTFTTTHFSTYVVEYVLSTGVIAGIIVAAVAVVAIVIVLVIVMKKKKAPKAAVATDSVSEDTSSSDADAE